MQQQSQLVEIVTRHYFIVTRKNLYLVTRHYQYLRGAIL